MQEFKELKMKLEAFGKVLFSKWQIVMKMWIFIMLKPNSKFNLCKKDAAIELYLHSLHPPPWAMKAGGNEPFFRRFM